MLIVNGLPFAKWIHKKWCKGTLFYLKNTIIHLIIKTYKGRKSRKICSQMFSLNFQLNHYQMEMGFRCYSKTIKSICDNQEYAENTTSFPLPHSFSKCKWILMRL